ncbi:ATP-grasp domain-containing protein [Alteribacter natronophilus]|uniref:ATP-grasp domain-containing protein n=1 Tax=Alteribacter natronophilus TaxID=2583810 RepID=UPI00110D9CAE|nr:alpha-L-glutamate ligase [Alteribacter natronophilus]TMW72519.1 alpha-L-glutamate ligase [Alteribacter natronophilus]
MSKIYIIHENDEWTAPLKEALTALEVPYEDWHLAEGTVNLQEAPPEGIFYNRMSASSHTRGHRYAPELAQAVIAWLESHGRTVLNDSRALQLELSKVLQYEKLKQFGIRTPDTVAAVGAQQLGKAAQSFPAPFITKHNRAGKGLGVMRFDTAESLQRYAAGGAFDDSVDGITLLQQFIDSPTRTITRCEFIGGKFLYAVRVDTSEGFELCPAEACDIGETVEACPTTGAGDGFKAAPEKRPKFEIIEGFSSPLIQKYEAFLAANGIAFAGIEFIEDADGTIFTYDVNTNTNYNPNAENTAGVYGMKELAAYLKKELHALESGSSVHS